LREGGRGKNSRKERVSIEKGGEREENRRERGREKGREHGVGGLR
jgi:hypothetical protein